MLKEEVARIEEMTVVVVADLVAEVSGGIVPEEVMTAGDQIAEEIEAHDPDPNNQK